MRELQNFVDGDFVDGVSTFEKISPTDGAKVAEVHEANAVTVDRAVRSARAALNGPWGTTSVNERAVLLRRIADRIEERFEDLLEAEIADTGRPESVIRELDVVHAAQSFRAFADMVASAGFDSFLTETVDSKWVLNYALRKPVGVLAVIVPWSLPLLLLTRKVAPAIAYGNAVVVKPSEESPSSATVLAEIMREAGVPRGVFNLVHGFGQGSAGELLTTHPDIDAVTFTGEARTGSAIMRAVAPRVRPVSFKLGGKNAAIVFDDAHLERTIEGLGRSIFSDTGQGCLCTERVYVQRGIYEDVVAGLVERAESLRLGDPYDAATTTGPLISQAHRSKVLSYLEMAEKQGGKVITGGGVPELGGSLDNGSWLQPTLWTGLDNTSTVMREEIFGPVAGLVPFESEVEAIQLANDTEYSLAAAVWTQNIDRGHRVAGRLQVEMAWVNAWCDSRSPFGGNAMSGVGRVGGHRSLDFYTSPTNVCIALGDTPESKATR